MWHAAVIVGCTIAAGSRGSNAAVEYTWTGGTGTTWQTGSNWTSATTPNIDVPGTLAGSPTTDDIVIIDGGKVQASTVTFAPNSTNASGSTTIQGLTINSGDTLTFRTSTTTQFNTTLNITTGLVNDGTITLIPNQRSNDGFGRINFLGSQVAAFNSSAGVINLNAHSGGKGRSTFLQVAAVNRNDGTINVNNPTSTDSSGVTSAMYLTGDGSFQNAGTINLTTTGANNGTTGLAVYVMAQSPDSTDVLLTGTGSVIMNDSVRTRIYRSAATNPATGLAYTGLASLTNDTDHRIIGAGSIGSDSLKLTNSGLIQANGTVNPLLIDPVGTSSSTGFTNTGRLVASGAAGMTLQGGGFLNTSTSLLEARVGSQITIAATGVTVSNNGDVRGDGTFSATTFTLAASGSLTPGDSSAVAGNAAETGNNLGKGASTVGLLDFSGNLALNATTSLNFQLGADDTAGTNYDSVTVGDALTLNGVLNVAALNGFDEGTYRLFTYDSAFALAGSGLTFGDMPDDYEYEIVTSMAGEVNLVVTAVPEPAALAMAGICAAACLMRRRRTLSR